MSTTSLASKQTPYIGRLLAAFSRFFPGSEQRRSTRSAFIYLAGMLLATSLLFTLIAGPSFLAHHETWAPVPLIPLGSGLFLYATATLVAFVVKFAMGRLEVANTAQAVIFGLAPFVVFHWVFITVLMFSLSENTVSGPLSIEIVQGTLLLAQLGSLVWSFRLSYRGFAIMDRLSAPQATLVALLSLLVPIFPTHVVFFILTLGL